MTDPVTTASTSDPVARPVEVADSVALASATRGGLVSYFDVGHSFGVTDDAFQAAFLDPPPEIGLVGLRNPFGRGSTVNLVAQAPELVSLWRDEAVAQVRRPEMETGWDEHGTIARHEFDLRLETYLREHPVRICELTLYSTGVVYLRFEMETGIDLAWLPGVLACFEFAAYRPSISAGFLAAANERADKAVSAAEGFVKLTARTSHTVQSDSSGYEEWSLFQSFTGVITYIHPVGDGPVPGELLEAFDVASPVDRIEFEYHGHLHYSWPTCVLQPRGDGKWTLDEELRRPLECIRIAHSALGTSEAFLRLTDDEINAQVQSYVDDDVRRRDAVDLNRLRTLGLAVRNLTDLRRVTQAEEDQEYFSRFAASGGLPRSQAFLEESLAVLYGVAQAEAQDEQDRKEAARTRREDVLNLVVVVLAALTLISVSADAYLFVRESESLLSTRSIRLLVLVGFVAALVLLVVGLLRIANRRQQR